MLSIKIGNKYIEAQLRDTSIEDMLKLLVTRCKINSLTMGDISSIQSEDDDDIPNENVTDVICKFEDLVEEREGQLQSSYASIDMGVFNYIYTHPDEMYTANICKHIDNVMYTGTSLHAKTNGVLRDLHNKGILVEVELNSFRLLPILTKMVNK